MILLQVSVLDDGRILDTADTEDDYWRANETTLRAAFTAQCPSLSLDALTPEQTREKPSRYVNSHGEFESWVQTLIDT